jgi:hypothetical protein
MRRLAVVVFLALSTAACTLHFGGDDTGDDACPPGPAAEPPGAGLDLRDPSTLECQSFGDYTCDPRCPCAELDQNNDAVPIPSWGMCNSACEGLAESDCRLAGECRAIYDYACYTGDGPCTLEVPYLGCYPVDQSGPVTGGTCLGLDAWSCSMHNDCIALHTEQCSGDTRDCWQQFIECGPELQPDPPCGVDPEPPCPLPG